MQTLSFLKRTFQLGLLSACLSVSTFASADSVNVAGIKVEDTAQVGAQNLKLNGAGVRYKVFFKVYVAALYLQETKSTTPDILALPGAKRVTLTLLRDLSNDDFSQRFLDGLRNNSDLAERTKFVKAMISFGQMFSSVQSLKKGDVMIFDWIPGTGIVCQYNGQKVGETINDPAFYNAVLRIWIGNQPADDSLKLKLLNAKSD